MPKIHLKQVLLPWLSPLIDLLWRYYYYYYYYYYFNNSSSSSTWGYGPQVHGVYNVVLFADILTSYCKRKESRKGALIGEVQGPKGTLPAGAQLDL